MVIVLMNQGSKNSGTILPGPAVQALALGSVFSSRPSRLESEA